MEDGVREEGNSHESSNQENKVMAEVEAMLISELEKLESFLVDTTNIDEFTKEAKSVIGEVKKIVEKMRDLLNMFPLPQCSPPSSLLPNSSITFSHSAQKSPTFLASLGLLGEVNASSNVTASYDPLLPLNLPPQPPLLRELFHSLPHGGGVSSLGGPRNGSLFGNGIDEREGNVGLYQNGDGVFEFTAADIGKNRDRSKHTKHFATKRHRRVLLNDKYHALRSLVPSPSKNDRTSIVGDAMLISELEKLESLLVDTTKTHKSKQLEAAESIIGEVKKIVEKVRDVKLDEEKRKLKYLISDVVKDVVDTQRIIKFHIGGLHVFHILEDLRIINKRFHELLQNDGVGEGDRDGDGDVVGLDEQVEWLLHKMKPITAIQGYDGFGKTTLAREVYNHADVVKKFKLRAWVNCFDIANWKELIINIIQQVASSEAKDVEKMELEGLQNMLRQQLMDNPYFIVLDNFWRTSCSEFVEKSLPPKDTESKLLLTCCTQHIGGVHYRYKIRPLDESNSWKLLLKTMLSAGGNNTCAPKLPKQLERRGKHMLMKHTDGVPLAIKDVAVEWAQKRLSGSEWEEVIESKDLELRASLRALESSFYPYLGPNEQSCFPHLSMFKQGTPISSQKFRQTSYVSRGILLSETQQLFEPFKKILHSVSINKQKGRTKYYQVGAIFHKLSIKIAKEENYVASHRAICCSRERVDCPTDKDERLISLFFHGGGCFDASPSYWKCFEQLRLLDFEGFGLKFIPETIGELIELRYLGLRNNYIQQLPHSLGFLKNLEVLDIALNFMVEVPDIIWEMEGLVHLYMSDISCRKPLKIEALKNLKTLTYISFDNWTYEESGLQMMTSLSRLGIEELNENSNVSKLFASLATMKNLRCLLLRGSRFRSLPSLEKLGVLTKLFDLKLDGVITMLPKAENFSSYLSRLSLVNSYLDEDPMPVLEQLEILRDLKLRNAYTGRQMVISEGGFPNLRDLSIRELWNLSNIQVGRGGLRYLIELEITSCPCLQSLPAEFTANIKELKMVTTNNIAAKIKKSDLFSKIPAYAEMDIQP